jgi:hypothetical protein
MKQTFLFLFVAALSFSCKKSDTVITPPAGKLLLSKVSFTSSSFSGYSQYNYDETGKLINMRQYFSGQPGSYETYEYDNAGRVTQVIRDYPNGNPTRFINKHTFNADNKIATREVYNAASTPQVLVLKEIYTYTTGMIESRNENGSGAYTGKTEYLLDAAGNVTAIKSYNASNTLTSSTPYSSYDTKKSPYSLLPLGAYGIYPYVNNVGVAGSGASTTNYTYEYNADGYVSRLNLTFGSYSETDTYEYKKL